MGRQARLCLIAARRAQARSAVLTHRWGDLAERYHLRHVFYVEKPARRALIRSIRAKPRFRKLPTSAPLLGNCRPPHLSDEQRDISDLHPQLTADELKARRSQASRVLSGVCREYSEGRCLKGALCGFVHGPPPAEAECKAALRDFATASDMEKTTPCKFFAAGSCRFGRNCRFFHDPAVRTDDDLDGLDGFMFGF